MSEITAKDVMCREVVTADMNTPVTDVIKIMTEKNIIRLPITKEDKLVGVVSMCDITMNVHSAERAPICMLPR